MTKEDKIWIKKCQKDWNYTIQVDNDDIFVVDCRKDEVCHTQETNRLFRLRVSEIKSEAIKEFAEKAKKALRTGETIMDKSIRDIIDNLEKEMVGEHHDKS